MIHKTVYKKFTVWSGEVKLKYIHIFVYFGFNCVLHCVYLTGTLGVHSLKGSISKKVITVYGNSLTLI